MTDLLFGWLLRGKCEFRVLDVVMFMVELGLLALTIYIVGSIVDRVRKRARQ